MLSSIPLLAIVVVLYNLIALFSSTVMTTPVMTVGLLSGAAWDMSVGDLLLAGGLVTLFVEVMKSTRTSTASIIDHLLSMILFIICLIEFLALKPMGTSTFFLLMLMTFVDVIAGFTVTISSARRDFAVGG